ncbi:Ryanodine receptor 3, partial [Taenia solium]
LQCFVFHLHMGLRAGGGVGDEIEPPDKDAHEALRILFDMSFFFLVIITLLAIIQGKTIPCLNESPLGVVSGNIDRLQGCVLSESSFEDGSAGRRNVFAYVHSPILEIVHPLGFSLSPRR